MKKVLFLISIVLVVGMFAALAYAATPDEAFKVADDVYAKKDLNAIKASMTDLEALAKSNEGAAWRFGRATYYVATRLDDPKVQIGMFQKAYENLKLFIDKGSKDVNSNYWFALNAGKYGKLKGVLKALFLVKPMKTACNNVIAKDPGYEEGGAYTMLGAIEYEVPGGDTKKTIDYCKKALKYNPDGISVNLYLAKGYYKTDDYANAKKTLEFLIANGKPETKDDKKDMAEAKELLAKVIKDMK